MSLENDAYASGRDRGWDVADAVLRRGEPLPEGVLPGDLDVPRAYVKQRYAFWRGWLYGLKLRRLGLGVDGNSLGFTEEKP